MGRRFPVLSRDTIYSPAFLDALREQLHEWSLTLFDPASGGFRCNESIGANVFSTTDVIWNRYATNDAELGAPDRDAIVRYIQRKQDPKTGMIPQDSGPAAQGHGDGIAFWQAIRALRILDAEPLRFPAHLEPMLTPAGLDAWFAGFNWDSLIGERAGHHHEVLGLIPAIASVGDADLTEALFRNIARQRNPETGTWPRAGTNISRTFAYTAMHISADRLPPQPAKIVDEMMRMQDERGIWDQVRPANQSMDAAYLLLHLPRRIGHREEEAAAALRRLSEAMRRFYTEEQPEFMYSPHKMGYVPFTLSILQEAFPDEYPSERPFRFDWDKLSMYACDIIVRGRLKSRGEANPA